ncbi:MAG: hypothetical protein GXX96_32285 [Planctomycetaceae bacterium]|nr:hypothetical protein [Planctomycetaceae bacterium]
MSAQDSNLSKPVRYRKPKADVFTLLLGIALAALIVACIFAYLEIKEYGASPFSGAPSVAVPVERPANLATALLPESQTTLHSPWRLHG